jgi:hypothetical protein
MGSQIPNSVIGATASMIGKYYYSRSKLDTLFMESGAPGEPKRQPPADWSPAILALHYDAAKEKKKQGLAAGLPEIEEPTLDDILNAR